MRWEPGPCFYQKILSLRVDVSRQKLTLPLGLSVYLLHAEMPKNWKVLRRGGLLSHLCC